MKTPELLKSLPLLKTERLSLREFKKNDLNFLHELRSSKTVSEMAGVKKHTSLSETEELLNKVLASFAAGNGLWWLLCLRHNQTPIGYAGIWNIPKKHNKGELGYMLTPKYFRKGYMTEALQVIIDFGFNKLNFHRLEAYIDSFNTASINLLKKFDFKQEVLLREDYIFKNNFRSSVILGKLKND